MPHLEIWSTGEYRIIVATEHATKDEESQEYKESTRILKGNRNGVHEVADVFGEVCPGHRKFWPISKAVFDGGID